MRGIEGRTLYVYYIMSSDMFIQPFLLVLLCHCKVLPVIITQC